MAVIDRMQDEVEEALNADGRSGAHVALGLLICTGVVAINTAVAAARPQPPAPGAKHSRHPLMRSVWPALFSLTTLAALRIWNAPSSPARSRALGLWGALQGLNMFWMLARPRDKTGQAAAAITTAGLTAVYAHAAAAVDPKAAGMVAPTGFAGLSALVARPPGN